MLKKELIKRVKALGFDKNEYWLIAGGAMVLYGIKEQTPDIDLGCTTALADKLQAAGCKVKTWPDGTRSVYYEDIEIFENWLSDKVEIVEGLPVVSITGLKMMKQGLGREKDLKDIALIEEFEKTHNY